jgi:hypothetical protein
MTPRTRTVLQYLLSVVLTIVLLYAAFRGTDVERLYDAMRSADYGWLLIMLAFLMISHVLRSLRWRYFLDPIKEGIGLRNLFGGVMIGYFMNNILPRAGELIRPYTLARKEGISATSVLGTIVVERVIDGFSFLFLLAVLPLMYDGPLREVFPWLGESGLILSVVMAAFMVIMIVLMFNRGLASYVLSVFRMVLPARIYARVERMMHSFLDGFLFVKRPGSFAGIFLLSVGVWAMYAAMMYAGLVAFNLDRTLGWSGAVVVLTISSIGVAIPTPGSTGSYHVFTSQTLSRLFHVPDDVALGFATLTHAVGYIGVLVLGLYFVLRDHIRVADAMTRQPEATE